MLHNQTFKADHKANYIILSKKNGFKAFWAAKIFLIYQQKCTNRNAKNGVR